MPGLKVGIALWTMERIPVHGVRVLPADSTCGWYIFAGEEGATDPDYYQPMCVEHVVHYRPAAVPFLALPPGWWFLTDGTGHFDARFDPKLLHAPAE